MSIPVYLFTGFLDAGKTKFIQGTLEDERFNHGERTLLLVCEEGEEEYAPEQFSGKNVYLHMLTDKAQLTTENLLALQKQHKIERCVIEYNGMWSLNDLYAALPQDWGIYQEMMFAEAQTFTAYNANIRQLTVDKLQSCEMVIFNRMTADIDKMALHKIVRGVSRSIDIAYDYTDGHVEADDIEDPLPFDLKAPIVEIGDNDFGLWYRDMTDEGDKYNGLTVSFTGLCATDPRLPKDTFAVGRHVMTCCEADIQYIGIACVWSGRDTLKSGDWVKITAKISIEKNRVYRKPGPVLYPLSIEPAEAPEQKVVTFS